MQIYHALNLAFTTYVLEQIKPSFVHEQMFVNDVELVSVVLYQTHFHHVIAPYWTVAVTCLITFVSHMSTC